MSKSSLRSCVAIALTCSLALACLPVEAASAALAGRIFRADGTTGAQGAVVVLVDATGTEYRAEPAGDDGRFQVSGLPVGSYSLVVETADGAFLAAQSLTLGEGPREPLSLVLDPSRAASTKGLAQSSGASWTKWVFVGVVGAASLFVINEVSDDEEETASPF